MLINGTSASAQNTSFNDNVNTSLSKAAEAGSLNREIIKKLNFKDPTAKEILAEVKNTVSITDIDERIKALKAILSKVSAN